MESTAFNGSKWKHFTPTLKRESAYFLYQHLEQRIIISLKIAKYYFPFVQSVRTHGCDCGFWVTVNLLGTVTEASFSRGWHQRSSLLFRTHVVCFVPVIGWSLWHTFFPLDMGALQNSLNLPEKWNGSVSKWICCLMVLIEQPFSAFFI